ncbi:MAG: hypothetical protein P9E67_11005 [Candidatus Competibacter sp.]|nr:hypothetical protein [Candidatus Competibacter sp.]
MPQTTRITDCWLWPERTGVRWWTPAATGWLDLAAPGTTDFSADIAALRDRFCHEPIGAVLAPALASMLADRLGETAGRLRLRLCADLPLPWQRFPFEYLSDQGQSLRHRLHVVRHVPRDPGPPTFPTRREILILDLWPDAERTTKKGERLFVNLIDGLEAAKVIRDHRRVRAELARLDLTAFAAMVVIGHGTRTGGAPVLLESGEPWALPLERGLPPLVVLVVCGNDRFNLFDYGQKLLAAGAQTVLVPLGELDAGPTDRFLRALLGNWRDGQTVAELLWEAQHQWDSDHGAGRLYLLGQAELHAGPARACAERTDADLAARALEDEEALRALIERITLRGFQRDGDLDSAVDDLYETLGIDYDDPGPEKDLLERLRAGESRLSPLARDWAVSYLVYLAEVYDHTLFEHYQGVYPKLCVRLKDPSQPPYVFYHWGKSSYRKGLYAEALDRVARGFTQLNETRLNRRAGLGLLGLLVGCLIDLNLPAEGLKLYDRLNATLRQTGDAFALLQRFNRLDRRARLSLRRGEPETALANYQTKRRDDPRDPDRDLAWLLYVSAWAHPTDARSRSYADEVREKLSEVPGLLAGPGKGNPTPVYLLRAYALWAWRAGDADAARLLGQHWQHLAPRVHEFSDPGPLGLALGYLHLYQQEHPDLPLELSSWEGAQARLEASEYWFELAALNSLLGRREAATRFLGEFHRMRNQVLPCLEPLPAWLAGKLDWAASLKQRAEQESALLLAERPPTPAELVEKGVLPL